MISPKKTLRVTMAASAATAMMLVATPGVAFADDPTDTPAVPAAASFTEPSEPTSAPDKATLTVHKLTPAKDETTANNGNQIQSTPEGSKPIEGVTFTPYLVEGIDLSTNEGWRKAEKISKKWNELTTLQKRAAIAAGKIVDADGTEYTLAAKEAKKTNSEGNATFTDAPRGLYVMGESIGDSDKVTVEGKEYVKAAVVQSSPFVVALPMTNQDDTAKWLTDVHVYPKNSVTSTEKSVEDESAYGAGDDAPSLLVYKILTQIPETPKSAPAATALDRYRIIDPLDSRLKYKGGAGASEKETIQTVDADGTPVGAALEKGTDYTIIEADATVPKGTDNDHPAPGKFITVQFTKAGRQKLVENQRAGAVNVEWKLPAEVKDVSKSGETVNPNTIPNQAVLQPNVPNVGTPDFNPKNPYQPVTPNPDNPDEPGTPTPDEPFTPTPDNPTPTIPGVPTNKVESKYGKVILNKVSPTGEKLKGAEFNLYHCEKGAGAVEEANKIAVNKVDKFVTDENGQLFIDGLRLNDWKNDGIKSDDNPIADPTEAYCLKEVKAPKGYELLPNIINFQLLTTDKDFTKTLEVKNVPANGGFNLPLTGGNGVFPLIGLGGLLVVGAAGYAAVAARRNRAEA